MQTHPAPHGLSQTLAEIERCANQSWLSVADLQTLMGDKGFGFLLVVLSLPSALPVPAPGYSIPFGILLILLGAQFAIGKTHAPRLPQRCLKWHIQGSFIPKMVHGARKFCRFVELFIRPRLSIFLIGPGRIWMGLLVIYMGTLMCIPIPGTNTLPAMVIFIIGVALLEEDGLLAVLATLGGTLVGMFYIFVLYVFYVFFFVEGGSLSGFKEHLKSILS